MYPVNIDIGELKAAAYGFLEIGVESFKTAVTSLHLNKIIKCIWQPFYFFSIYQLQEFILLSLILPDIQTIIKVRLSQNI
jgi:hypothetical protein